MTTLSLSRQMLIWLGGYTTEWALQHGSSLVCDFHEQEVTAPLSSFTSLSVSHLSITCQSFCQSHPLSLHITLFQVLLHSIHNIPVFYPCFPSCLNLIHNIPGSSVLLPTNAVWKLRQFFFSWLCPWNCSITLFVQTQCTLKINKVKHAMKSA